MPPAAYGPGGLLVNRALQRRPRADVDSCSGGGRSMEESERERVRRCAEEIARHIESVDRFGPFDEGYVAGLAEAILIITDGAE